MDRLTKQWGTNPVIPTNIKRMDFVFDLDEDTYKAFQAILDRLAAYENTGITPEQIEVLQEENAKLTTPDTVQRRKLERIAAQADAHGGIDHLVALDQAAMDGKLFILPCKLDDTVYIIENVYKGKKIVGYQISPARIDHFTLGDKGTPVLDACTENSWYVALDFENKDYFLTVEAAQKEIDELGG